MSYAGDAVQNSFNMNRTTLTEQVDAANTYSITRKYDGMGRQFQINSGGVITDTLYSIDILNHTTTTATECALSRLFAELIHYHTLSMRLPKPLQ